jgi:plastocyanin
MTKLPLLAAGVSVLALGLAACGSSSSSSSSAAPASSATSSSTAAGASSSAAAGASTGGSGGLSIAAQSSGMLAYTKKTLTAKAGTVKIAFTNAAPLGHNLTIQKGTGGAVVGATPTFQGGTKTLTVKLAPGKYTFYCSVAGHRMAGMQGTLTVT